METPQPLDSATTALLGGSSQLVYYSLGSVTVHNALSRSKMATVYDSFASFPNHRFLVKADDEWTRNYTANMKNVALAGWWPQHDLLAHSGVKLFITHVGHNSVVESAYRGVPLLSIPLFYDMARNGKAVEWAGYSVTLKKWDLNNRERVVAALGEALGNPRYAQRAKKLSSMLTSRLQTPSEVLVDAVEFVLRAKSNEDCAKYISLKGGWGMELVPYLHLDVVLVVVVAVILISS